MPRRSRLILPNVPLHIIQRGNNRQICFAAEDDYQFYLEWLARIAKNVGCHVHAYVLMSNHVHLLLSATNPLGAAELMKALGQRYVQYFNRQYRRSGTLWEGRFRSCLVQEEGYLLACHRYIELNPVRAGMVEHPAEYVWSSYRANAQGEANLFVTPHLLYLQLGNQSEARLAHYRELFRYELDPGTVDAIRSATNGNYALGSAKFADQVERALQRRASRGKPGRPCKPPEPVSRELF